jgi:hypothetical protein
VLGWLTTSPSNLRPRTGSRYCVYSSSSDR